MSKRKWEEEYEKYLNGEMDDKIKKLDDKLQNKKTTKEEYDELNKIKKIKANLPKVKNILELKEELGAKAKLIKEEINRLSVLEKANEEAEKIEKELTEIDKNREEVKEKLKEPNLEEKKKVELQAKLGKLNLKLTKNNEKYLKNQETFQKNKETKLEKSKGMSVEELEAQSFDIGEMVSKCNMAANKLMQGESWDAIEVKLENWESRKYKADKKITKSAREAQKAKEENFNKHLKMVAGKGVKEVREARKERIKYLREKAVKPAEEPIPDIYKEGVPKFYEDLEGEPVVNPTAEDLEEYIDVEGVEPTAEDLEKYIDVEGVEPTAGDAEKNNGSEIFNGDWEEIPNFPEDQNGDVSKEESSFDEMNNLEITFNAETGEAIFKNYQPSYIDPKTTERKWCFETFLKNRRLEVKYCEKKLKKCDHKDLAEKIKKLRGKLNPVIVRALLDDGTLRDLRIPDYGIMLLNRYVEAVRLGDKSKLPFTYNIDLTGPGRNSYDKKFEQLNKQALIDNKCLGTEFKTTKYYWLKKALSRLPVNAKFVKKWIGQLPETDKLASGNEITGQENETKGNPSKSVVERVEVDEKEAIENAKKNANEERETNKVGPTI